MGLFDDIVPPDIASSYVATPPGFFDDIVPPASQPRVPPLARPVRLAQAPAAVFGDNDEIVERPGQYDEVVVPAQQPRKASFGANDAIVESPANPSRINGTPERLVPLAPTAEEPARALGQDDKIVESPTSPLRVNGTPEHSVPLAPQGEGGPGVLTRSLQAMFNGVGDGGSRHAV